MMTNEFVLRGGTLVDSSSDGTPTDLLIRNGKIAAQGTPQEVRDSVDPLVHQFVNALPEGPVRFHYPAAPVDADFSVGAPS